MTKMKVKERILKTSRIKQQIIYKGDKKPQINSDVANGPASLLATFPKGSTVHQSSDFKGKAEGSKNNRAV